MSVSQFINHTQIQPKNGGEYLFNYPLLKLSCAPHNYTNGVLDGIA